MSRPPEEPFERARPRLVGLAYRITGSLADAEDVVSEVWLQWSASDQAAIGRPEAWWTTVTARRAVDHCRATARRRRAYPGPYLPDPVVSHRADPEAAAELAESLSFGFVLMLGRLDPVARAVFLLADVWGWPYAEIADAVGRSAPACRQVASRARRRLRADPTLGAGGADPTLPTGSPAPGDVVDRLVAAIALGDLAAVLELLAPDVVMVSDGGASVRAARRPVVTPGRVARLLSSLARRMPEDAEVATALVNGSPGLVIRSTTGPDTVTTFAVRDGLVTRIWSVLAPDKLVRLDDAPRIT